MAAPPEHHDLKLPSLPPALRAGNLAPDGREIAFHSFRSGSRDVFVMPAEGGTPQQVTNSPAQESYPIWSPDGNRLSISDQGTPTRLLVATRDASGKWTIIERLQGNAISGAWSPDGRFLAAARNGAVVVVPADSGEPREIYTPRVGALDPLAEIPKWINAGTIVFKAHTDTETTFWSVPTGGGTPRLLARFDDPNIQSYRSDWTTDGKRLYFPIQDRQSDLWVVELRNR